MIKEIEISLPAENRPLSLARIAVMLASTASYGTPKMARSIQTDAQGPSRISRRL